MRKTTHLRQLPLHYHLGLRRRRICCCSGFGATCRRPLCPASAPHLAAKGTATASRLPGRQGLAEPWAARAGTSETRLPRPTPLSRHRRSQPPSRHTRVAAPAPHRAGCASTASTHLRTLPRPTSEHLTRTLPSRHRRAPRPHLAKPPPPSLAASRRHHARSRRGMAGFGLGGTGSAASPHCHSVTTSDRDGGFVVHPVHVAPRREKPRRKENIDIPSWKILIIHLCLE